MKINVLCFLIFGTLVMMQCTPVDDFPVLTGDYLGQELPGMEPELFAPGIVSTGLFVRDVAITPDGNEFYFGVASSGYEYASILVSKRIDGRWTKPEVTPFTTDPQWGGIEPCISPDGQKFYFVSSRPNPAAGDTVGGNFDIWVMDRLSDGWGEPYNLGAPVNTEDDEYFPSVTTDGTLYYTRQNKVSRAANIYRSHSTEGAFVDSEKLPEQVNSGRAQYNAFIAPDERYIIVPVFGRPDGFGRTDYYIVYRNADDSWGEPINLGAKINTAGDREYSPYVTRDGQYFFFMSGRGVPEDEIPEKLSYQFYVDLLTRPNNGGSDIYWVNAEILPSPE